MKGLHFTTKNLNIGELIISHQSKGRTYDLVWEIYNQICLEKNNRSLFKHYGYAYPIEKNVKLGKGVYIVESDNILSGNLDHSLYVCMDKLTNFMRQFSGVSLKEKLEKRAEFIRLEANKYFVQDIPENKIELISDSFKIISKT